ncbi:hypothetical protein LTS18_008943 [Coniosporium uncinatum]|uniref:Uncharacterized protein n=1 Tax=Coniosporium uncinatum TaxID=93489 RepID=A0ACC3DA40_9PEZI|nr:hypothetical protein LTS18_008943 [Coniosporium uncinatum]
MANRFSVWSRDLGDSLDGNAGAALQSANVSFSTFAASLITGLVAFGVQVLLFLVFRARIPRIYAPRTYLVPERERAKPISSGLVTWIPPLFKTSSSEFINRCGLDAYLFLRYLRMLLKIFVPLACLILPILLPLNNVGTNANDISGMDKYGWQNITPEKVDRFWGHLCLAVIVVTYVCYTFYSELRGYIRLRQAYLTSPQHRLRASATTVLVTNIPRKWLTYEALDALYDVFPGGIRNIWINHNYDELSGLVSLRNKYAGILEGAETNLIKTCKKKQLGSRDKEEKNAGVKKPKAERKEESAAMDGVGEQDAEVDAGMSAGNPHQIVHTLEEALDENSSQGDEDLVKKTDKHRHTDFIGEGLEAVEQGFGALGHGVNRFGETVFGAFKPRHATERPAGLDLGNGRAVTEEPYTTMNGSTNMHAPGVDTQNVQGTPQSAFTATPQTIHTGTPDRATFDDRQIDGVNDFKESKREKKSRFLGALSLKGRRATTDFPSPQPFQKEEDEFPLTPPRESVEGTDKRASQKVTKGNGAVASHERTNYAPKTPYDEYNQEEDFRKDEDAAWRKWIKPKDRDTMRTLAFEVAWWPSLPLIGKKYDTIYYCRHRLAQLNYQVEELQKKPNDFPIMNSAFIQFNNQVAAHMACQSLSHHVPKHMAPRVIEVDPKDVMWDSLSMVWWNRYIRTAAVIAAVVGLVITWAIPVSFTGALSQISSIADIAPWLSWLNDLPKAAISIIQGVAPPILLGVLTALFPLILRFLCSLQGKTTGMATELSVQNYFFFFTFVQVFLVVSISSGITATIQELINDPLSIPETLANNLPKASNYFFSYMIVQALSVSAGSLLQVGGLLGYFILAPLFDSTARDKWKRKRSLNTIQWGTFFPVYTNFGAIGIIYSVISPLILVFNIITFSLFWVVYRYTTLFVLGYSFDTGGLLFPKAINQLFTGLYFMEICLIGLFFLAQDAAGNQACIPQAIIMIVVLALTVLYQFMLNDAFGPLYQFIPISMEDDAVRRDEEFERAQSKRWQMVEEEQSGDNIQGVLEARERKEEQENQNADDIEMQEIATRRVQEAEAKEQAQAHGLPLSDFIKFLPDGQNWKTKTNGGSWADRSRAKRKSTMAKPAPKTDNSFDFQVLPAHLRRKVLEQAHPKVDIERQNAMSDALYGNFNDELEDLTAEERDKLVQKAFLHTALRSPRPCIWIPRDDLGVSDDEVRRTAGKYAHVWIDSAFTGLDHKGRVLFRRPPPDFQEIDLIQL